MQHSLPRSAFTAKISIHYQGPHSLSKGTIHCQDQHSLSRTAFTAKVRIRCRRSACTVMWAFTFAHGHHVAFKLRLPRFVGWPYGRCFCFKHRLRPSYPKRILWMLWSWHKIGHNTRSISRWSFSFEQHSNARTEPTLRSWQLLSSINSLHFLKPTYLLPRS